MTNMQYKTDKHEIHRDKHK